MAGARKRKHDVFDPTKSDSDDQDYAERASSSRPRKPQSKKSKILKKPSTKSKAPNKRQRRERYQNSDDDDEIESLDNSEEDFDASSQASEEVETNPATGRAVRAAAKKTVKYEEKSDEEEDTPAQSESEPELANAPSSSEPQATTEIPSTSQLPATDKPSPSTLKHLIIKLKFTTKEQRDALQAIVMDRNARPTRSSTRRPTPSSEPPRGGMGTRRSSRISQDREEPLVALSNSGRHEQTTRAGTNTPEPEASKRPTRGGKGMKRPPSMIEEEGTQEEEQQQPANQKAHDFFAQLEQDAQALQTSQGAVAEDDEEFDPTDEQMIVAESENEESEEEVVTKPGRSRRAQPVPSSAPASQPEPSRGTKRKTLHRKADQSSNYDPDEAAEAEDEADVDISGDEDELARPSKRRKSSGDASSNSGQNLRRSTRNSQRAQSHQADDDDRLNSEEVADELAELGEDERRNKRSTRSNKGKGRAAASQDIVYGEGRGALRRRQAHVDYRVVRPETQNLYEEDDAPAAISPKKGRGGGGGGGGAYRQLFSTAGPFGGAGEFGAGFGAGRAPAAIGGDDSDSSDDEGGGMQGMGGAVGETPTTGVPKPFNPLQHQNQPMTGAGGGPPALGRVKDKKALADADPLGVDANVTLDGVGGLQGHVDSLKEMAMMPLLYPELFLEKGMTPPRGVLFHGPPGTGKTHLARALSNSVTANGQKVTFYMRKGADALSKWVGEAEKQLRMLFEEARKNQPSIIFFDEIDGLAPVRSSKQDQIHSSIVATLLALMDGMDGRGQVIVIGATNRPDSVDPALRRPGRFDREFYFPLPDVPARRAILDINTKLWKPAVPNALKDNLAGLTRGYSGADLRALCTEAFLNANKRTYPQIYTSNVKLVIDPKTIEVKAKDFMLAFDKMIASSERSAASGAAALKTDIEPLLRKPLTQVTEYVEKIMPRKRKATALEEAMYEDPDDDDGFNKDQMMRHFESSRVFRPRLLIKGYRGMGQQYLGAAILSKLDGVHVQTFELATILKESSTSPEAAIVTMFEEIKRNKPSVIYLPNVNVWYDTMPVPAIRTFVGLLNSLNPTDPVLVLGVLALDFNEKPNPNMMRDIFGYSRKSQYVLARPNDPARKDFFQPIIDYIRKAPSEFPAPENRKKRKLDVLPVAPPPEIKGPTEEERKAQAKAEKKRDRLVLSNLKMHIQPIMDQIKKAHRRFRTPVLDQVNLTYLFDDEDPNVLSTDLQERDIAQRPYERSRDEKGVDGLRNSHDGRFFYNIDTVMIEKRLSNGYYKRPRDFLADIKRIAKDAKNSGDEDRSMKANEMLANVEVDIATIEQNVPGIVEACNAVYEREQGRERELIAKANAARLAGQDVPRIMPNVPPAGDSKTTTEASGPIVLGERIPGAPATMPYTPDRMAEFGLPGHRDNTWSTSNGDGNHTNGSTVPSRPADDSEMTDSQRDRDPFAAAHSQAHAAHLQQQIHGFGPSQGQHSQRSAHTQLQPGSQLHDYYNSASTTTSGQKTSDHSNRSSGPFAPAGANGLYQGPDFSYIPSASGGSQLPDTQEPAQYSSQASGPANSQPGSQPQPQRASSISALLNAPAPGTTAAEQASAMPPPPPSRPILDPKSLASFEAELSLRASGLSVEQLEQINAGLMATLWQHRGEWNRNQVLWALKGRFEEDVEEIVAFQKVVRASQEEVGEGEDTVMGGCESGFGLGGW